jgi:hypothetical protein
MDGTNTDFALSRRAFAQLGSLALMAAGVGCTSQPAPEAPKTQPSGGAAPPSPPAKTAKAITGTAPNTAVSKEYVQMVGRFAYFWGWPMVNSFNRRTAMASVPEPGLRGGILPNAPLG